CYGYHRQTTPNIDRVAAEGWRFTRVVSSSSWTVPSHGTLFTGLLPCENGFHTQHVWLIDRIPTLAELLKEDGYRTAGYSNNPQVSEDHNLTRGFDSFEAVWADTTVTTPRKPYNTEHTNRLVKSFLEEAGHGDRPFFIFINYMNAHLPYVSPEPFRSRYTGREKAESARIDSALYYSRMVNYGTLPLSRDEFETVRGIYDGALSYLDAKIGELLNYLEESSLYDSTLVVITADHGEVFGEYGHFTHGKLLYRPLVQIPLVVRYPPLTARAGQRDELVGIADIFHSITRLLGIKGAAATGAPVCDLFAGSIEAHPCYSEVRLGRTSGGNPTAMPTDGRALWTPQGLHYIFPGDSTLQCFDPAADPDESENLCPGRVGPGEALAAIEAFEAGLNPFIEQESDLRITSRFRQNPQYREALKAIGYVDGKEDLPPEREHPHVREHLLTGVFFFNRGSVDRAEREFRTAFFMNPASPEIRKCLGKALVRKGKNEEAARVLRSVVQGNDQDAETSLLLAQSLVALERQAEALELLRGAAAMHFAELKSAYQAAEMLIELGDPETADLLLDRLLQEHSYQLEVLHRIIGIHCRHRNWGPARRFLLEEVARAPGADAYFLLGHVCIMLQRVDEARLYLGKLLTMEIPPQTRRQVEKQLKMLPPGR
ncbi:MAG: sulfatase-like hydrolase/transferase, partial [Candidatus Glassbacteria bacterium]|nr:sulfatase-like hydrolase/transferase [Candidatus Glassbacteria bacterium]